MTDRIKVGDTVSVTSGKYAGRRGVIEAKRSTSWVVVFTGGGSAQLLASQLKKVNA